MSIEEQNYLICPPLAHVLCTESCIHSVATVPYHTIQHLGKWLIQSMQPTTAPHLHS